MAETVDSEATAREHALQWADGPHGCRDKAIIRAHVGKREGK